MPIGQSKSKKGLEGSNIMYYGAPGSGKTLSAASFPGAVFVSTEPGIDHYAGITRWESGDGRYVPANWNEFMGAIKEVVATKLKWLVVDTIDNAVDLAARDIMDSHKVQSLNDDKLSYGKGTALLVNRVKSLIRSLVNLPCGVVITSHKRDVTIEPRVGESYTRYIPSVQDNREGQVLRAITSQMDLVLYLDHDGAETRLRSRPHTAWESKDRIGIELPEKPISFEIIKRMHDYLVAGINANQKNTKENK